MFVSLSDSRRDEYKYIDCLYNNPNINDVTIDTQVKEYYRLLIGEKFKK